MSRDSLIPLIGRDLEQGLIEESLERAKTGISSVLALIGEPGIGKSRLLQFASKGSRARAFGLFSGRSSFLDRGQPYALLSDTFRAFECDDELKRISRASEILDMDRGPGVGHIVDAFLDLIELEASQRPVALLFDDLQWADVPSLLVIRQFIIKTKGLPVAYFLSSRTPEPGSSLDALIQFLPDDATVLELKPLSDADALDLARRVAGREISNKLAQRISRCAGNPFYVIETASQDGDDDSNHKIPKGIEDSIIRTMTRMTQEERELVEVVSILGSPSPLELVAKALDTPVEQLWRTASQPRPDGLIRLEEGSVVFRHELVREAIYSSIPAPIRKKRHRLYASKLANGKANIQVIAAHAALGATPGDTEAFSWILEAGRQIIGSDPGASAELFLIAKRLVGPKTVEGMEASRWLERSKLLAGSPHKAEIAIGSLLDEYLDPAEEALFRIWLARSLMVQGRFSEALECLRKQLTPEPDPSHLAMLRAEEAQLLWILGLAQESILAADKAVALAGHNSKGDELISALSAKAVGSVLLFDLASARECVDEIERIRAEKLPFGASLALAVCNLYLGNLAEAEGEIRRELRSAEFGGASWLIPCYHAVLCEVLVAIRRWDDALAEHHSVLESSALQDGFPGIVTSFVNAAWIHLMRGDLIGARNHLDEGWKQLPDGVIPWRERLQCCEAALAESLGEYPHSLSILLDLLDQAFMRGDGPRVLGITDLLAELASRHDDVESIRAASGKALPLLAAQGIHTDSYRRCVRWRALMTRDPDLALEVVQLYEKGSPAWHLWAVKEEAARLLGYEGRWEEAAPLLRSVLEAYQENGFAVRPELRQLMARAGIHTPKNGSKPSNGWASLTKTEREVLRLIAMGYPNAVIASDLVISKRTVESHVSRILAKLGIRTRTELIAKAIKQGF